MATYEVTRTLDGDDVADTLAADSMPLGGRMERWARALMWVVLFGSAPTAQQLPVVTPESVGISAERLERMHRGMQGFIDRREAGGVVTLVAREGKVVDVRAYGWQDVESRKSMRPDTIFRIASMSKPITSVAVMMLYEDGRLLLNDPISKYIQSFKNQTVIKGEGSITTTVPAQHAITIRDLLTHRSGLSYGFLDSGPVGDAYRRTGISDGLTVTAGTIAENVDRLAAAPLLSEPGSEWHYSLSVDVLGRLIEVVSGMPFDVFLRDRIFKPLAMTDTSFEVPDAKWSRLATVYSPDGTGGIRPMKDPETFVNTVMSPVAYYKSGKRYFSGGAGLTSTTRDYSRFAQMLLNGGELDGVRLLSPKTVELMTTSHTSDLPRGGLLGAAGNFGLGFRITVDLGASQTLGSAGMYGWAGIYGTNFWVDPKERLIGLMMVQRYPGSTVAASFQALTYQALTRSAYLPAPRSAEPVARRPTSTTSSR